MTDSWPRPRLVVSGCLELEPCRYNGQRVRARFLPRLADHVDLVPVCPEVEIGLGVPRPPIRLVSIEGSPRLVQPETSRDLTSAMEEFGSRFLDRLGLVDGFLLKSRSPSCGPAGVKVYGENGIPGPEKRPGLFAGLVTERLPDVPMEDEGRLLNASLRGHFLTRLFQGARLRALPESLSELVRFHADSKLLLLVHSEVEMRRLGRIVANQGGLPVAVVLGQYRQGFARALARSPQPGPVVNTLMHAAGHFSRVLLPAEKGVFGDLVRGYVAGQVPLDAPVALLRGWIARHPRPWLATQSFLAPYPTELRDLADSAGGNGSVGAARVA